ncbi:MAG: TFIIB-type zinc ribbon-containing protein [Nitrososphaerota archaeon]|nr:transcription initiation factor IIB [Nitrososphaerales archaeon]MDW8044950.1 TFIIB-type zinc ribbon-containing protein [Nitrososphaerota archaeon]
MELSITKQRCPICGRGPVIMDANEGEVLCSNCGSVLKDSLTYDDFEQRVFSSDDKESRVGLPTSLAMHDRGLATMIGSDNEDALGKPFELKMMKKIERIRIWDRRSQLHENIDRNLKQAFTELRRMVDRLNLSGIVMERAAYIYRKALKYGLLKGRSINEIITASLYAACRELGMNRTLKDIAKVSFLKRKDIARCYRLLLKELDLRMPLSDPIEITSKIANEAQISEKTRRRAIEIIRRAKDSGAITGKDPNSIAAAALYLACKLENESKTQEVIAKASGVTEVTIRNRYKALKKFA